MGLQGFSGHAFSHPLLLETLQLEMMGMKPGVFCMLYLTQWWPLPTVYCFTLLLSYLEDPDEQAGQNNFNLIKPLGK